MTIINIIAILLFIFLVVPVWYYLIKKNRENSKPLVLTPEAHEVLQKAVESFLSSNSSAHASVATESDSNSTAD